MLVRQMTLVVHCTKWQRKNAATYIHTQESRVNFGWQAVARKSWTNARWMVCKASKDCLGVASVSGAF